MAVAYSVQQSKRADAWTNNGNDSYPPTGLSSGVKQLPEWIQLGCGNDEYVCKEKGATFTAANQPDKMVDLSQHNSFFADTMRANPGLWDQYKNQKTSLGVTFAHCIKTGVDNKGHPNIKTVGAVAGDEESYTLFNKFFDPVISDRHNGYAADARHPTDLDVRKLSTTPIDPTGKYVLTSRCRTGRSVRGTRLPPCTTFEERREVERVVVKGLLNMTGDLAGDYFPLAGSRSYAAKPGGMTEAKEESLRSRGNLFQEPDSTLLLSSGCGRHWPDARGIFHNNDENLFVWVNEEDQMRIVSMEKGDNVKRIIERFAKATSTIQTCLKAEGYDFMHSDHLGWILTCPSNLGTGLRAGAMVKVPLISGRRTSETFLAAWVSKPEVPLVSTLPLLVEPGISPTPIDWANPKSNWSISSSKVLLKSSDGNKLWKRVKTSMLNSLPLVSQRLSPLKFHSPPPEA